MKFRISKGLSLIEVIFSIFLIALALVIYATSLNLVRLVKAARYQNVAYHLAEKKMEELRNTEFDSLPPSGPLADAELNLMPSGSGYLYISDVASDFKQVKVEVSWVEATTTKQIQLDTLIFRNGLNSL